MITQNATFLKGLRLLLDHLFQRYVDFRRGNWQIEKHCYKPSDTILLTFDDYASATQTERLIATLEKHQVRAMFFLQGDWASEYPELVARLRNAGHIIGNHTLTHPNLRTLSDQEVEHQIGGEPFARPWFRPPYGSYDKRVRAIARRLGYVICYWTIDSHDWTGHATKQDIVERVLPRLHKGAVILLHAHIEATIDVLPQLIKGIQDRGYQLDSFSDPLWDAKGSPLRQGRRPQTQSDEQPASTIDS